MAKSKRGLASADDATRKRVAKAGGQARANDPDVRSGELGRKGGQASPTKFTPGDPRARQAGRKGGQARASDPDVKSGELGRMGAQARWGTSEDQ